MNISEINKTMESKGVTAYEISKGTGIAESTIGRILSGKTKRPNASTLGIICKYLEEPVKDLEINKEDYYLRTQLSKI